MKYALCCMACVAYVSGTALGREWRDVTGQYTMQGDFLAFHDHRVRLRHDDGRVYSIEWSRLSERDRQYAEDPIARQVALSRQVPGAMAKARLNNQLDPTVESLPQPSGVSADAQATHPPVPIFKRVYYGHKSTFHLIEKRGTATYWFHHRHWLSYLRHTFNDPYYYHYQNVWGDPFIVEWAIARVPSWCHKYAIWYKDRGGWHLYDWADREIPK